MAQKSAVLIFNTTDALFLSVFLYFQRFNKAAEDVKNLQQTPTDDELLELYALYKQSTVGDVNTREYCSQSAGATQRVHRVMKRAK
jgi:hypothetical protein